MGKGFQNKTCVYCGREGVSRTADHVIARGFFPEPYRVNIPKVPACVECNNGKSTLEHYVLAVLPLGATHSGSAEYLNSSVKRRLDRNLALRRELGSGWRSRWVKDGTGPWMEGALVPFRTEILLDLCRYIVLGLAWHHWNLRLAGRVENKVDFFNRPGRDFLERIWSHPDLAHRVERHWGGDIFNYRCARMAGNSLSTVWEFWFFGNVALGGDPRQPGEVVSKIYGATNELANPSP